MYHTPVLLTESISGLITCTKGIYVDLTFGGGGHSRALLEQLAPEGQLFGFDQDPDAQRNSIADPRFQLVSANFRHWKRFMQFHNAYPVNGVLADLGVSSYQFDTPERGFSHRLDGRLDMRMNHSKGITAADVVNQYTVERLTELFAQYGEVKQAYRIAQLIEKGREEQPIEESGDLKEVLKPILPPGRENKILSQIFQALRIEVNEEMDALKEMLQQTVEGVETGGRIAVISYHSLEDRLVKNFFRSGNFEGKIEKDFYGNPITPFKLITRKAIVPSQEEISRNNRARSAKLRIVEKIDYPL